MLQSAARKRRGGQHEAEKIASGIAHEDPGRIEIEKQEPDQRPHQRSHGQRNEYRARNAGYDETGKCGEEGDARRQAIETIDQVDRVGHADDPQDRHRESEHPHRERTE